MSNLARLKRRLKWYGITHEDVAKAAGVTRVMVNHMVNGKAKSARVQAVAERLISERRRERQQKSGTEVAVTASMP